MTNKELARRLNVIARELDSADSQQQLVACGMLKIIIGMLYSPSHHAVLLADEMMAVGEKLAAQSQADHASAYRAPISSGVVAYNFLDVRARPGIYLDNPPIASLKRGAEVSIFEEREVNGSTWYRIGENRWVYGGGWARKEEPAL